MTQNPCSSGAAPELTIPVRTLLALMHDCRHEGRDPTYADLVRLLPQRPTPSAPFGILGQPATTAGATGAPVPSYGVSWSTSGYVVYTKPEGRTLTPEEVERALGVPPCRVEEIHLTPEQRKVLSVSRDVSIPGVAGAGGNHA